MIRNILIALFFLIMQPTGDSMAAESYSFEPAVFMEIPTQEPGQQHLTSPAVPSDTAWRGVIIAAPQKLHVRMPKNYLGTSDSSLSAYAKLPVSLYYCFESGSEEMQHVNEPDIIVRDTKTSHEYQETVRLPIGVQAFIPYVMANGVPVAAGGYDAHNILKFIQLPAESAVYTMQVVMGNAKSNQCEVEVIIEAQ